MADKKYLSILADRFVPQFVREDHPKFVDFIVKYFEFLEQEKGYYDLIANLDDYSRLETSIEEFKEYYKKEYAPTLPQEFINDLQLLIKHAVEFYQSKGAQASYEFLFRYLFNTYVDFYYPREDILKVSDGNWIRPYYLVTTDHTHSTLNNWVDLLVRGVSSGATGYVTKLYYIEFPSGSGTVVPSLQIDEPDGFFQDGEEIEVVNESFSNLTLETGGNIRSEGYWVGEDGFLNNQFIQDNYYFQQFSYEVISDIEPELYKNTIRKNVHPSGFKMFSSVRKTSKKKTEIIRDYLYYVIEWIEQHQTQITTNYLQFVINSIDKNEIEIDQNYLYYIMEWIEKNQANIEQDYLSYVIEWIEKKLIVVNYRDVLDKISSITSVKKNIHDFSWKTYERNREEIPYAQKFNEIEQFEHDNITIGEFEVNSPKYSILCFDDGLKRDYDTYDCEDGRNIQLASSLGNGVRLSTHYLNPIDYVPETFIGDDTTIINLSRNPVEPYSILVFVDGIKQYYNIDYIVSGSDIEFNSPVSSGKVIEVIYLEHENFVDLLPEQFSGDGSKEFTLSNSIQHSHNILVFVDGKYQIPYRDYTINQKQLNFRFYRKPSSGTNNIDVTYINNQKHRISDLFVGDGNTDSYFLSRLINPFIYENDSYLTTN